VGVAVGVGVKVGVGVGVSEGVKVGVGEGVKVGVGEEVAVAAGGRVGVGLGRGVEVVGALSAAAGGVAASPESENAKARGALTSTHMLSNATGKVITH